MTHRISPKQLKAAGWTPLPRTGKAGREYLHNDGWRIEHCGHPTALWPYLLIDPDGGIVLAGAAGPLRNPTYGTAWSTVRKAVEYVATIGLTRRQLLRICR
jgi:hypothetical protein